MAPNIKVLTDKDMVDSEPLRMTDDELDNHYKDKRAFVRSLIDTYIRKNEGVADYVYDDPKKNKTWGIGHKLLPGEDPSKMDIEETYQKDLDIHTDRAYKIFPELDRYPVPAQVAIIDSVFRGNLSNDPKSSNYSPKTIKLIREGKWGEAAKEYVRHSEYEKSKASENTDNPWTGVYKRMDRNANLLRGSVDDIPVPMSSYDSQYIEELLNNRTSAEPSSTRAQSTANSFNVLGDLESDLMSQPNIVDDVTSGDMSSALRPQAGVLTDEDMIDSKPRVLTDEDMIDSKPVVLTDEDMVDSKKYYDLGKIKEGVKSFGKGVAQFGLSLPGTAGDLLQSYAESMGAEPKGFIQKAIEFAKEVSIPSYKPMKLAKKAIAATPIDEYYAKIGEDISKSNEEFLKKHGIASPEGGLNKFLFDLGSGVGSVASAIGLYALTKSPNSAALLFGTSQKGQMYKEARKAGKDVYSSDFWSTLAGIGEGGLEYIGLDYFMRGLRGNKPLLRTGLRAATEAVQEASQQLSEETIAKLGWDREGSIKDIAKRVLYSGLIGGLIGLPAGAMTTIAENKGILGEYRKAGLSDKEAEEIIKDIQGNLSPKVAEIIKKQAEEAKDKLRYEEWLKEKEPTQRPELDVPLHPAPKTSIDISKELPLFEESEGKPVLKPEDKKPKVGIKSKVKSKTLISAIKDLGGIDTEQVKKDYNWSEDIKQHNVPISIFKKGAPGLDEIANELESQGILKVPDDMNAPDYLMQQLKNKQKRNAELYADKLDEEYNKEYEEWVRKQEEAGYGKDEINKAERELEADIEEEVKGEIDTEEIPDWVTEKQPGEVERKKEIVKAGSFSLSEKDVDNAVSKYASQSAGFVSKLSKTVGFSKLIRKQLGKPLWEDMSKDEQLSEVRDRIIEDLKIAKKEVKGRNIVDYLLNRALDPLDPMSGVYKLLLKKAGATITNKGGIKLSSELQAYLSPKKTELSPDTTVYIGRSPQKHTIIEQMPKEEGDLPDEVYFKVKNNKTGEVGIFEKSDLATKPRGAKGGGIMHDLSPKEREKLKTLKPDSFKITTLDRDVDVKIGNEVKHYKKGEDIYIYQDSRTGRAIVKDGEYGILPKKEVTKVEQAGTEIKEFLSQDEQGVEEKTLGELPKEAKQEIKVLRNKLNRGGQISYHEFEMKKEDIENKFPKPKYSKYRDLGGKNYREVLFITTKDKESPDFKSSHWDEPNVVSHARISDVTVNGKKYMAIEEIQSDWAREIRKGNKEGTVKPTHPLLKKWREFTLKRLVDKAVKEGYDGILWTTGQQQADRYDLSKKIDFIRYSKKGETTYIQAQKGSQVIIRKDVPNNNLEATVGKEPAKKILDSKENSGKLSGLDLKIGGEWAKSLYDVQIPSILKKMGGKLKRVQVQATGQTLTQPAIEITPTMRKKVLGQVMGGGSGTGAFAASASGNERKGYGIIESSEKSSKQKVAKTDYSKVSEQIPKKEELSTIQNLLSIVAPARVSKLSVKASLVLRKGLGRLAHKTVVAQEILKKAHSAFTWMDKKDSLEFIDKMEKGEKQGTPKLQEFADTLNKLLVERREKVQGLGKGQLESFYVNYFPHIWKDPKQAKNIISQIIGKKRFEGSKSFLKKRVIMSVKDGVDRGLELVSDNPVDIVLLKLFEMDRYIMAQETIKELKDKKLLKFVYIKGQTPDGWSEINDNAFTVYMPPKMTKKEAYDALLVEQLMDISQSLGIDTKRFTSFGRKQAWGLAYLEPKGQEKVRTKYASPESVLAHEIGHVLGTRYDLYNRLGRRKEGKKMVNKQGREFIKPTKEALEHRRVIDKEWRELADARYKDTKVNAGFKKYVRKAREKEAVLLEAYIHAPNEFKRIAPNLYKGFTSFLNEYAELRPLLDVKPSLVLGESDAEITVPGLTTLGHFYAPDEVARLINNHLSPGLRNNKNKLIANSYNITRGLGNILNQINLSLSAFHGFNVTTDMYNTAIGLIAMKLTTPGQRIRGILDVAKIPFTPIFNIWNGTRIKKAYRKQIETIKDDKLRVMVERLINSGGRERLDAFYYNQQIKALRKTFRDIVKGSAKEKSLGVLKLPFNAFGAALETAAKPLMEWYVPTGKLGTFAQLASYEMKRAENGEITEEQLQERLASVWDSVDNRMGQLVYDNLFWNKILKDSLMFFVRSPGWNIGSQREFGGAVVDLLKTPSRIKGGDKIITHKMAYALIGAPITYMFLGAAIMKLLSGDYPETFKDYFFPRTGRKNPDGSDERISPATYSRDIYSYSTDPISTISHKKHPLLPLIYQQYKNKDFYNVQISDPKDPILKQLKDRALHIIEFSKPFSFKNYDRMITKGEAERKAWLISISGFNTAPSYITRSPAQKLMNRYISERIGDYTKTKEEYNKSEYRKVFKFKLRKGEKVDHNEARAILGDRLYKRTLKEAKLPPFTESFKRLTVREALNVYAVATNKERRQSIDILTGKIKRAYRDHKLRREEYKMYKELVEL